MQTELHRGNLYVSARTGLISRRPLLQRLRGGGLRKLTISKAIFLFESLSASLDLLACSLHFGIR